MLTRVRGQMLLAVLICTALVVAVLVADQLGPSGESPQESRPAPEPVQPASEGAWVTGWSAAPTGGQPDHPAGLPSHTVRNVLQPTTGGSAVRIELSNRYGQGPLRVTHATVALSAPDGAPAAQPETLRRLSFDSTHAVAVPAGESRLSDPTPLSVPNGAELLVSVYAPEPAGPTTHHRMAQQTSYLAQGDRASSPEGAHFTETVTDWRHVTAVQLFSKQAADGAVAVLGDSLTDGITSTPNENRRWTDRLAQRLQQEPDAPAYAVVNAGISGNRLLRPADEARPFNGPSGLQRLSTDVLSQQGVRSVVIQLGINDIIRDPSVTDPAALVAGLQQAANQVRDAGLQVTGATLAPFEGHGSWTPYRDAVRQQVNEAIRDGEIFDTVVDFDAALRDPSHSSRMLPRYDSGDGLHPSDAGYSAMADAVPLEELRPEGDTLL